jgi:hypothetical protein
MDFPLKTVLAVVAAGLSVAAAIVSVVRVYLKGRAEKRLLESVLGSIRRESSYLDLINLMTARENLGRDVDPKMMAMYEDLIVNAITSLDKRDAFAIREATRQRSSLGKLRYVRKLLDKTLERVAENPSTGV